ncbi:MAG: crotonase/enoyl-CoA hydratase family protein [Deltaproteobacteria bacterium]|nr:crotonase/enoyl-CoA hydratase family protein [Deltaproteobacteria bacterium]
MPEILYEKKDHLAFIQINRPEKRNAFTVDMFRQLGTTFAETETDADVRCTVVHAAGHDFTSGLDFANVAPAWASGERPFLDSMVDPWGVDGKKRTKPMVVATQGRSFTLGTEWALASDTCVAASDSIFALKEVRVAIYPAGGGTFRFIQAAGWGNAMRYVLTGDEFDAAEAYRLGVVQEVVEPGKQLERAVEIAETMAAAAPLGVRGAIASGRAALERGEGAAIERVVPDMQSLLQTEDAQEAMMALMERRPPKFKGR